MTLVCHDFPFERIVLCLSPLHVNDVVFPLAVFKAIERKVGHVADCPEPLPGCSVRVSRFQQELHLQPYVFHQPDFLVDFELVIIGGFLLGVELYDRSIWEYPVCRLGVVFACPFRLALCGLR